MLPQFDVAPAVVQSLRADSYDDRLALITRQYSREQACLGDNLNLDPPVFVEPCTIAKRVRHNFERPFDLPSNLLSVETAPELAYASGYPLSLVLVHAPTVRTYTALHAVREDSCRLGSRTVRWLAPPRGAGANLLDVNPL